MALVCENCGKGSDWGHNVSHAKNRTKRVRKPNLHRVRVLENGKVVRKRLCSKCLRRATRPERNVEKERTEKKTEKENS